MTETPVPTSAAEAQGVPISRQDSGSRLVFVAAIILGIAAVLTAWGTYREGITSSGVLRNYSEQQALIAEANDAYSQADAIASAEEQYFLSWAINTAEGNEGATDYLEAAMSDEMVAAVVWWADQPDDSRPPTPFVDDNPDYALLPSQQLMAIGDDLVDQADARRLAAEAADATSDQFGLANVFFAVVLFIAGIAALVTRRSVQLGIILLSVGMLAAGMWILATTPGAFAIG